MSTAGMLASQLLPGHHHIRVHLHRAGTGGSLGRGESLCGAPPVALERIEAAREGVRVLPDGRRLPLPGGALPVQLVTCRDCVRLVEIHVLAPWQEGDLEPGISITACGAYAIRDPALVSALKAFESSPFARACPRDRLIAAADFEAWAAFDHAELWRVCRGCDAQLARHARNTAARELAFARRDAARLARPPKGAGGERKLRRAVARNPAAAIRPEMAALAQTDSQERARRVQAAPPGEDED